MTRDRYPYIAHRIMLRDTYNTHQKHSTSQIIYKHDICHGPINRYESPLACKGCLPALMITTESSTISGRVQLSSFAIVPREMIASILSRNLDNLIRWYSQSRISFSISKTYHIGMRIPTEIYWIYFKLWVAYQGTLLVRYCWLNISNWVIQLENIIMLEI